jgi:CRP-like cAMP-binding protein
MRVENVAAGKEVVRQGEPGERFYLIAHGAFEVMVDEQPVTRLGRGEYFGELALLNDAPRAATVVAVEPGRLYSLGRAAFRTTLAHDLATQVRIQAALAYREAVAAMLLFRDLAPVDLDLLLTRFVQVAVATGEDIIRQGESGDRFYVIRSGAVDVIKDGQTIGKRVRGDAFGELALLLNAPRAATVRATEPTELLALNAADFQDLLVRYLGRAADLERLTSLALPAQRHIEHESRAESVS